ncbi:hypothetical protein PMAYCL1PPCAC_05814, partial [Pristionchus mayeri]
ERMRSMMGEYSEKEIRDERIRREIFDAARKVCKGMAPGNATSPRYEFIERLMVCGNMEAKKAAIDELALICDHEMSESCSVRRWMKRRNVLTMLLSDHLDHPEYVNKIGPILRKLAPVLSEREFRMVWCLQKGRGGISTDTFAILLANLVSGFQEDQIFTLFKYFRKQLRQSAASQQAQHTFLRITEIILVIFNRQPMRPPIPAKERQMFIECYIRMLDRFLVTNPCMSMLLIATNYAGKIADLFRGLAPTVIGNALSKLAREVNRMKERDPRFPFYFTLVHNISAQIKTDIPLEFPSIGPLLQHHNFAERCTRQLIAFARFSLAEVEKLDQISRMHEEMGRVRAAFVKQQLQQSSAAAATTSTAADAAASAVSSLQPSPIDTAASAAAAVVAPPPSAVTPISNGPSPKRDGSPPTQAEAPSSSSSSVMTSSEAAATDAAPATMQEEAKSEERKEETVMSSSVCTPPCTPEPLRVSTARVGTKEYDKELAEITGKLHIVAGETSMRLMQFNSLMMMWMDTTMTEEPIPGCNIDQLPDPLLEEVFGVLVESSRNGLHKRIIQYNTMPMYWSIVPHSANTHTVIRNMLKFLEPRPVFRSLVTKLCSVSGDLASPIYVDIVRNVTEMCFNEPRFNTSMDWLDACLRFLWRAAISRASDVRERAVDVLKQILCEHYDTLQLLGIFAVARFNEAIDDFNRFSGRDPLPHWDAMNEDEEEKMETGEKEEEESEGKEEGVNEEEDGIVEEEEQEMVEEEEEDVDVEMRKEEEEEEDEFVEASGEEEAAVDLSLEPAARAKVQQQQRASSQFICRETIERLLRGMEMRREVKSREDAEVRLSRTISFLRRIITYGYLETECSSSLIVRDRAIPGEVCELILRVFGPVQHTNMKVSMAVNEPLHVFADRVKMLLPPSPPMFLLNWPRFFKVRHFSAIVHWERGWSSIGEQLSLNSRAGVAEDCQVMISPSPFNEDFSTEASARRDAYCLEKHGRVNEVPLGFIANETKLVALLHAVIDGPTSSHLQEAVLHCIQQLPLQPIEDEEALLEICDGALSLHRPHQALYHLISLLSALLPPQMTCEDALSARRTLQFLLQIGFIPRFVTLIREIDVISERLSVETLTLFHEVCLTLIRLFYLHDSGKHRSYKANFPRLPHEPAPLDTSIISDSLTPEDLPHLLRTLCHFTWATVAPRRIDVERELSVIVTSPSERLRFAKEKKVETSNTHRRTQLARTSLATILEIATRYGSWRTNLNALFNHASIEGVTVSFWRDMLMNVGSIEIQHETRCLLSSLLDRICDEEEKPLTRRMMSRFVFELGRAVWGPSAALAYSSTGRNPIDLLKLAEKVVRTTRPEEMDEGLLDEWVDLQIGFFSEERPAWNAKCAMSLHVQLLQELLKKYDRETMAKTVRRCLSNLLNVALFPFASGMEKMDERNGLLPAEAAVGHGLTEGDVRRKYMDIVLYYAQEFPQMAMLLVDNLCVRVHGDVQRRRLTINWWEKAERFRRQRAELQSFCGPQLNLAQRLHNLAVARETDVRMVKGLINPSYMCYANSVLQQLVFMPGVCEALFAIGETDREFGDLTEEEDIRNGALLRNLQSLFAHMLFSAEPTLAAEGVLSSIDLPSGGNVREQQDCVEFFLTLIDKCDMAAEKFCRPPVFKRFLEGVMGYEYACKTCKHRHRGADESFTALNLEIHGTTVGDSLDHFMEGALLEGASAAMCEQCGEKRTTLRIGALRSAPTTLCIQLKRFSTYDSNGGKLNSKVDVPRHLDLTRFSEAVRTATDEQVEKMFGWFDDTQDEPVVFTPPPDCPVRWRYRLVGVIVHSGQLGNGHYTSYVKERRPVMRGHPWFDHWLLANDDRVSVQEDKLSMEWQGSGEENTPSAYLLWYEMVEDDAATTIAEGITVVPEDTVAPGSMVPLSMTNGHTVAEKEEDTAVKDDEEEQAMRLARLKAESEWMDIGLGSLGVLEGPLLSLYKCVPDSTRRQLVAENIQVQLGRDVLTESYAKFLLQLMEVVRESSKRRPEEKHAAHRKLLTIARLFATEVLWRTNEIHAVEAENTISTYRLFISNILKEHTDFCKDWLSAFYDPTLQAISEETREFTTNPHTIKVAISTWWWLASQAVVALRADCPHLIEAYCRHMIDCLRLPMLRVDGFTCFFTNTYGNPHCIDFHIKHNIVHPLINTMFYVNKKTMTWGLHGDLTSRNNLPINAGLFTLFREAIERDVVNEDTFKHFVQSRLHLAMGPMTRHGEEYLMKMIELLVTTLRVFGERDDIWTGLVAQAILNCLKIDPHRANGLFTVITAVGKSLSTDRCADFYDEIMGKRETDAAENGLIVPGVVPLLETMLEEGKQRESRLIQMILTALMRAYESVPAFRDCADAYADRIRGIRQRAAEWKEREAEYNAAQAQLSATRSMLVGADAMGMLPIDACGPINRPPNCNVRDLEMVNFSDDDLDDDEEEMLSDEEDYSEGEGPVNLSNHRRT